MTDKQITSNDYIFELNEMCIDCISEIDECECRKIAENLHFKLYRKEQECEELRKERKNLKWDLENNIQVKNHAMEENSKLKQTLTEIKEIAEDTIDMFYEGLETGSTYDRVETILQKISECEVKNENN